MHFIAYLKMFLAKQAIYIYICIMLFNACIKWISNLNFHFYFSPFFHIWFFYAFIFLHFFFFNLSLLSFVHVRLIYSLHKISIYIYFIFVCKLILRKTTRKLWMPFHKQIRNNKRLMQPLPYYPYTTFVNRHNTVLVMPVICACGRQFSYCCVFPFSSHFILKSNQPPNQLSLPITHTYTMKVYYLYITCWELSSCNCEGERNVLRDDAMGVGVGYLYYY